MEHQTRTAIELRYSGNAARSRSLNIRSLAASLSGFTDAVGEYRNIVLPLMNLDAVADSMRPRRGAFVASLVLLGEPVAIARAAAPDAGGGSGRGMADVTDVTDIAVGFIETIGIFKARVLTTGDPMPNSSERAVMTEDGVEVTFAEQATPVVVDHEAYVASKSIRLAKYLGRAFGSFASIDVDMVTVCAPDSGGSLDIPSGVARALRDVDDLVEVHKPLIETRQLQIDTIQFSSDKWRFKDGDQKFYARIADRRFLAQWDRGEISFKNGDRLNAVVRTERSSIGGTLTLGERSILKVSNPHAVLFQPSIDDLMV
ncbi:hypothetical protein GFD17_07160 [Bifidobacterium sp. SMB2]|uniref:Uncharacterized protein n=1 Tax=Bifidobacterium saimiriisciurei TaxID=2661627 RepID=A0ABX0C8N7_9BIFI|nr:MULTISPECIES: hypothetical protein [Bifidobacterium]NEG96528.1 hypothetical protein [Bifidobacterium sp. SMB2]NEH10555.1 hypothetical protein [Bifidobacterium saimiriisciurei]NEH10662.1 hypothetical protein [Bifidobacterium saimiriisciurei]